MWIHANCLLWTQISSGRKSNFQTILTSIDGATGTNRINIAEPWMHYFIGLFNCLKLSAGNVYYDFFLYILVVCNSNMDN